MSVWFFTNNRLDPVNLRLALLWALYACTKVYNVLLALPFETVQDSVAELPLLWQSSASVSSPLKVIGLLLQMVMRFKPKISILLHVKKFMDLLACVNG